MSHRHFSLWSAALLVCGAWLATSTTAHAEIKTFGFDNITNNKSVDTAIGEAQLFVDVFSGTINLQAGGTITAGPNQVGFRFYNVGSASSSITGTYFDDGSLLGIAQVINGTGVDYSQGGTPQELPGGNGVNFHTTSDFRATADPPPYHNGVNPNEEVVILFNLIGGQTYQDTLNAIQLGLNNPGVDVTGGLRIGIHVQGFDTGGSESFVNGPPSMVPEPSSVLVWSGMGLVGALGIACKRRAKRRNASGNRVA